MRSGSIESIFTEWVSCPVIQRETFFILNLPDHTKQRQTEYQKYKIKIVVVVFGLVCIFNLFFSL